MPLPVTVASGPHVGDPASPISHRRCGAASHPAASAAVRSLPATRHLPVGPGTPPYLIAAWCLPSLTPTHLYLPTTPPLKRVPPIAACSSPSPFLAQSESRAPPSNPLASRSSPTTEARHLARTPKKDRHRLFLPGEHHPRLFFRRLFMRLTSPIAYPCCRTPPRWSPATRAPPSQPNVAARRYLCSLIDDQLPR
jgi:hypothetical protein